MASAARMLLLKMTPEEVRSKELLQLACGEAIAESQEVSNKAPVFADGMPINFAGFLPEYVQEVK